MREDHELEPVPKRVFRELSVNDVVRVLKEKGQSDLIKKLELVRGPA